MPLSLPIIPLLLLGRCAQGQIFKGGFGSRSLGLDQVRDETSPEKYPDYGKCVFGNKPKSSSPLDQFRDDQELIMERFDSITVIKNFRIFMALIIDV